MGGEGGAAERERHRLQGARAARDRSDRRRPAGALAQDRRAQDRPRRRREAHAAHRQRGGPQRPLGGEGRGAARARQPRGRLPDRDARRDRRHARAVPSRDGGSRRGGRHLPGDRRHRLPDASGERRRAAAHPARDRFLPRRDVRRRSRRGCPRPAGLRRHRLALADRARGQELLRGCGFRARLAHRRAGGRRDGGDRRNAGLEALFQCAAAAAVRRLLADRRDRRGARRRNRAGRRRAVEGFQRRSAHARRTRSRARRAWAHPRSGARGRRTDKGNAMIAWVFVVPVLFWIISGLRVIQEYESGVIFRLGRFAEVKRAGLNWIVPGVDRMVKVDLRTVTRDVPPQDVITRDNVSLKVSAVIYFRVIDAGKAVIQVENFLYATSQRSHSTRRSTLGKLDLDDLLAQREKINKELQQVLDLHTEPWGIKVTAVEVKAIDLPPEMQRAIARQAEAERERRAKVIAAEGEDQAAEKLGMAADVIQARPSALQLRYLQTLVEISAEKASTTIFPLPIDLLTPFIKLAQGAADQQQIPPQRLPIGVTRE